MTSQNDHNLSTARASLLGADNIHPLSKTGYLLTALYLTVVGVVATIGNITVICVLCRYGTFRKRSINMILLNMAVSDLGVSIAGYPLTAVSGYWQRWLFGDVGCQFYAFCVYTLSCSTICSHVVIAIYRYVYIVKPDLRPKLSANLTYMAICGIWVYALLWTVPPFLGWSSYVYEPFGTSCSINWFGSSVSDISYMVACTLFVYALPIMVMLYCYLRVAKKIRGINPQRTEERDAGVLVFGKLRRRESKIDTHVTKMCFLMMITFVIVWTPYAIESLWAAHAHNVSDLASVLPTMFAKSSCMMNPIIFLFSSSKFRRDVRRLVSQPANENVEERTTTQRTQRTFYVRQTAQEANPMDNYSASVYYDKERIYIGQMRATNIQKEAELLQRDPEALSIRSSSGSESDVQFVLKDRPNRYNRKKKMPGPKGPEMFIASGSISMSSSGEHDSKSQSTSSDSKEKRVAFSGRRSSTKKKSARFQSQPEKPTTSSSQIFTLEGCGIDTMLQRKL
ncbi:visual pigment-like receptor peropsin [Diadema antillarum]|uniref:visual pigment-like receptor peropsin n=1 Tax=Diadema antillarum TaxID=105358 RepID=UPI003A861407